jgi:DnaJ-class molecular chaperone
LPELGTRRVGDLFVKFRVVTPKNMSDRQKQLLVEFANEEVVKSLPKADGAKSEYSSKDTAESKETEDTA